MSGPRVLLLPAFSAAIGGGHALRCFTLAQALATRAAVCAVGLADEARAALSPFVPAGVDILRLDDRLAAAQAFAADAVVIDDYGCDATQEAPLAEAGFKLAVIDDLADRPHRCDLLADPGYGREAAHYHGLVPPAAQVLAGPDYALLRPEFAASRPAALTRRKGPGGHRVLVSLGLTDVGGRTARIAQLLNGLALMDVVLGSASPSATLLKACASVTLHLDARNVAELIAAADIGVGGGGVSVWERACLGLPSIVLILADNQAQMAHALDAAGAVIALDARQDGWEPRLVAAVERLFSDGELKAGLSQKAAHLCDGRGADRVADALLAQLAA